MKYEEYKNERGYISAERAKQINVKLSHSALFGMKDEL